MSLHDDVAATRARSRTLCLRSIALCTQVLSLTTPLGETVLPPGQWRYFAARLSVARCAWGPAGACMHADEQAAHTVAGGRPAAE